MLVYVRPQHKYSKSNKSTPQEIKTKAISLMFPFTRLLILQLSKSCIGGIFYIFTAHRTNYYFRIYPDLNNAIYGMPVVCILSNVPCTTFNHLTMNDKVGNYDILLVFLSYRSVFSTSWRPIHRSKSHFKETWGSMVMLSVTGGISSSMETNAVDRCRLRLVFTITGRLVTSIIISCIIGHLRDTVKTFHKGRLEWNYG